MIISCADCDCRVDRGVRTAPCSRADCCCSELPTQQSLAEMAGRIRAAFQSRDLTCFEDLLADDARWGADDAPHRCRSRRDVIATFQRLLAEGVGGEVTETKTGPAGILCHLRLHWPEPADRGRRDQVLHLYRVRHGQIVEIEPYDDQSAAEAALTAL